VWFSLNLSLLVLGLRLNPGFELPDRFALHRQLNVGVKGIDFVAGGVAHERLPYVLHNTRFHKPGIKGVAKVVKAEVAKAGPADGCFPCRLDSADRTTLEGEDQAF
jgi:hypothetical protein